MRIFAFVPLLTTHHGSSHVPTLFFLSPSTNVVTVKQKFVWWLALAKIVSDLSPLFDMMLACCRWCRRRARSSGNTLRIYLFELCLFGFWLKNWFYVSWLLIGFRNIFFNLSTLKARKIYSHQAFQLSFQFVRSQIFKIRVCFSFWLLTNKSHQ